MIDADVHVAPASVDDLAPYLGDYWVDYVANAELSMSPSLQGAYPPAALHGEVPTGVEGLRAELLDADGGPERAVLSCLAAFDVSHNAYFEAALCRAVNDWMRVELLEREPRLAASLALPTLDPVAAAEEIERLGPHPQFVQALLPIRTDAPYGNPRYHPIYAAAERHGIPIGLHAWGRAAYSPTTSGFAGSYLQDYVSNSQVTVQAHVTSLVSEGVFERFPGLRVVLAECGFAWLPFLLWRFDKDWKALWREVPWVKERPSAYVRRHVLATTAPAQLPEDRATIEWLAEMIDAPDVLLYASDHPHRHGGGIEPLLETLGDDGRAAVLHGNAAALYGLAA